jgi:predicted transcriptional regulator of viral defense system
VYWTEYCKLQYFIHIFTPLVDMPIYTAQNTIHELAYEQHGVFKAAQAVELGVHPKNLVAMAARGHLRRLAHGLYQDRRIPEDRWTRYMAATLWPYGVVGYLARETVLSLLELSDVNTGAIHLIVPHGFRPRRRLPMPGVAVHRADLPDHERTAIEGVPATTVARAIRDCAAANIGPALLRQAMRDARAGGWLKAMEAQVLEAELTASRKI